ncbi:hypothetical protein PG994_002075 [Apiospora phragmitis]|uniref:Kinesin motor domain-containing protein n=1 Tax=Apiospora phragmitis TaxID=2905665 RepID=A0ABR1WVC7_9PEZI
MASSPPGSPSMMSRPASAMTRPSPRSNSRMSLNGKSRASDEDGGRTAVKVVIRVRPPLQSTDPGFDLIPQRFQRSMVQATSPTSLSIDAPQGKKLFVFDRVFSPDTDQEGVWDYLSESVNAFLQGYNVSLLAYGQSGAGKSFTMATELFEKLEGPSKKSNRNSMSQLRAPQRYTNWQLKATYVEIYNEQLRDLLVPETTPQHERGTVTIREDTKGNIILTGLRQMDVHSIEDLMNALNFGSTIRQTDATAINAKSSRSHAVFSLNLVQRKPKSQGTEGANKRFSVPVEAMTGAETWVTTDSKLHFVDLAGSERLKNTGAQGERAKEGISINAGLAALGKVISQLSSRSHGAHVSYRDSRLTRLLQDSLGGNAITYMIACVTPAEFHLSETLNTVQYAQRARAIQSKPRIQSVEEGDKQAIIERLKAEVAFLREQIRSSERGGNERRNLATTERSERLNNEREAELQNQLLDVQENYTTLSQRHAKLIAEMAKARDNEEAENQQMEESAGDSATDRLARSNSFAQAVEQVVLEYEKTIQSLEQSLSSTRTTLSNTETNLLEKETKCAYIETINTQLQARLQKLMDREANTENYLHDLETKLDGHTSGEEKNATIILELRKEIARVRENEAAAEDYISTLEERLAEADQDTELMQREIDRLEQVIERQRSLGKLDNLLHELDNIQPDGKQPDGHSDTNSNGFGQRRNLPDRSSRGHTSRPPTVQGRRSTLPEVGEEETEEDSPRAAAQVEAVSDDDHNSEKTDAEAHELPPPSPAQSKFVADKLETVTEELVHLRVEHESTLHEFDALHNKYEEALKTLAELQDAVDEAKHPNRQRDSVLSVASPEDTRPPSFLSDAQSSDVKDGTRLSSRSLSSELSSAMDSPATIDSTEIPDATTPKPSESKETLIAETANNDDALALELEKLKSLALEKESAEKKLATKYAQLEEQHQEALDMVEELKTEVMKARHAEPTSPRSATPVIRRKSSQNVMVIDRAHRSFASLRNIAADNFEGQPDVMQNFELNLNAAMHELHARSERIQELEADVSNTRKEMETKMTIINGLTRERSSLKSSPMDMSMIATLKNQLEQNESQLRQMKEVHAARETELMKEIESLRASMQDASAARSVPTETPAAKEELVSTHEKKIAELQSELAGWEGKHQTTLDNMQATERTMQQTIKELESRVAEVNANYSQVRENSQGQEQSNEADTKHQDLVTALTKEIGDYKTIIDSNAAKVAELESAHSAAKSQLEEATRARDLAAAKSDKHRDLLGKLEAQIAQHEETIKIHQENFEGLEAEHARDIDEIQAESKQEYESQLSMLMTEHAENIRILESDLCEARDELMKVATEVAYAMGLEVSVEKISERVEFLIADQKALGTEKQKNTELENHVSELASINNTIMRDLETVKSALSELLQVDGEKVKSPHSSVSEQIAALKKRMADLEVKNKKHSRLVEELEDQLQTNFDQAQITNNRLSTLQTERQSQLEEATTARIKAQSELEAIKEEYAALQVHSQTISALLGSKSLTLLQAKFDEQGSNSNSQVRKTASHTSLPSPPPAIPLPPLPGIGGATSPTSAGAPGSGRPQSNDMANLQIREDQEARIRSIERHLNAEKQLTSTLEEALTDLEKQSNKVKTDCEAWRKRAVELENEVKQLKEKPQQDSRWRDSLHQVEEERKKRQDAERARAHLEERMNAINNKKKKKGSLNCF